MVSSGLLIFFIGGGNDRSQKRRSRISRRGSAGAVSQELWHPDKDSEAAGREPRLRIDMEACAD
jgi:hypothetical protein